MLPARPFGGLLPIEEAMREQNQLAPVWQLNTGSGNTSTRLSQTNSTPLGNRSSVTSSLLSRTSQFASSSEGSSNLNLASSTRPSGANSSVTEPRDIDRTLGPAFRNADGSQADAELLSSAQVVLRDGVKTGSHDNLPTVSTSLTTFTFSTAKTTSSPTLTSPKTVNSLQKTEPMIGHSREADRIISNRPTPARLDETKPEKDGDDSLLSGSISSREVQPNGAPSIVNSESGQHNRRRPGKDRFAPIVWSSVPSEQSSDAALGSSARGVARSLGFKTTALNLVKTSSTTHKHRIRLGKAKTGKGISSELGSVKSVPAGGTVTPVERLPAQISTESKYSVSSEDTERIMKVFANLLIKRGEKNEDEDSHTIMDQNALDYKQVI